MLDNHRFLFNQHLFNPFYVNELIVVKILQYYVVVYFRMTTKV